MTPRAARRKLRDVRISVVIPALDEEPNIAATVGACVGAAEVIVVDGGSGDRTVEVARAAGAVVEQCGRGRALQMNSGAAAATGDVLLFVHADTTLPAGFAADVVAALEDPTVVGGRFDIDLQPSSPLIWLTARLISLRSRLSRIATGDQCLFVRRAVFEELGGYQSVPIMEDLALSIAMKRCGEIACLRSRVVSSSRRWRKEGVVRTILLMWTMRFLYFLGVSPERLARWYANTR